MATADFFDTAAELGSEGEDEDYDEETGEIKSRQNGVNGRVNGRHDDSSEEDEEDDDEEAERAVREGFIVDEDEEEGERRRRKKKRRRERIEEEEGLDEEDLDLIGEANPELQSRAPAKPKFKRLKQGHREGRPKGEGRGVDDIFSDDDIDDDTGGAPVREARGPIDEFADFIEEDTDEEGEGQLEELEVARPLRRGIPGVAGVQASGLDEAALEDMRAAFGDGAEYDWALDLQEATDDQRQGDKTLELKDVFEPSQLAEKMLTDEDNIIRMTDIPERFQIARAPFKPTVELTEQEAVDRSREEALWISNMMLPKKPFGHDRELADAFQKSVAKVLEFINHDDYDIPFIAQNRKDYLIHASKIPLSPDPNDLDKPKFQLRAEKLLEPVDLWEIFEFDLKFRALVEKREALKKTYSQLKDRFQIQDDMFEDLTPRAVTMEELQDVQDYLHFQYSAELKDIHALDAEATGVQKRASATRTVFEKVRAGKVYSLVRAFGIAPDSFAQNAMKVERRKYTEDVTEKPEDLADSLIDSAEYATGSSVLKAAKAMYAEELAVSPRLRKYMRQLYYTRGLFNCYRTEKGLRKISEDHPYYEFKYLRNQELGVLARRPDLYLRMLQAEKEGLVEVKIQLQGLKDTKKSLYSAIESDNFSEAADAWNALRREAVDMALSKLEKVMTKGVKENFRTECENQVARSCRDEYYRRLDQAPYRPKGERLGTVPRVLALSNGIGGPNDAVCWVWVEEDGRVLENGKFNDLRLGNPEKLLPDGPDVKDFIELVRRRKPDVIAVSGFSVETRRLYRDLQEIVDREDLRTAEFDDEEGNEKTERIDVIITNDEVARLYQNSERSFIDYPKLGERTKYCVALAKYLQDPMKEYAALGTNITSISFDPSQNLVPQAKILKHLETAMVDIVNIVGVDVNEAVADQYTQNLLPYICGLGPRKAAQLLKAININGGVVTSRSELLGEPDSNKVPAVGPTVWQNCASFLYIVFDPAEPSSDFLDNTRVHPEDYDLARKMAADALEFDEEDIKAEVDENGPSAVSRKLVKEEATDKVYDLVLEDYAEQLETNFNQRKRAILETIREEYQTPYEELRRNFALLSTDEVFTMLTGETRESLCDQMIVPVTIRRVFTDHIEARLDCGIEGSVSESEFPSGVGIDRGADPRNIYTHGQVMQAKVLYLNRKALTAQLSIREDALRRGFKRELDHMPHEWDQEQEDRDKREAQKQKEETTGRAQRVIKHPLFRPFNSAQAEEYLGSQARGEVVIRPSSKGLDHLAVTWKVSDGVFQHIDVLELDKENEFSVGRTLKIGGKYTYSDLDELIVNHVKAMAKKVDEMMTDERYQTGTRTQTEQWLTTYTEANPKRSMYAFCINAKYPGYFFLCFKAGQDAPLSNWPVKVIPNAFELQRNQYPDTRALRNGFKLLVQNNLAHRGPPPAGRR